MTATDQAIRSRGGRPRDPGIDDRVRAAVRELLVEAGWDATTIRGVAARAGVSRAALLRRWPSKAALVLDTVLGTAPDLGPFDGVDRDGWVRWVAQGSVEIFARPEVRAAVPGLLATLREQPELRQALWRTFTAEPVTLFVQQHPGPADQAALDARSIIVLAAGGALLTSVLADEDDTPALRRRIEEILLGSGIVPRNG